jgi:hypothetical protein
MYEGETPDRFDRRVGCLGKRYGDDVAEIFDSEEIHQPFRRPRPSALRNGYEQSVLDSHS